jgi:hypothetical protein
MIGLGKDTHDERNGERFTLTMHDPGGHKPGYGTDRFADLTEDAIREMLRTIGESEDFADRLLQKARADFLGRQRQTTQRHNLWL